MAPVMMLNQSVTFVAALAGRDIGWSVQRREGGALPWGEVARGYIWHTLFGLTLAAAAYAVSWSLFLWMSPVIAGLLLAIPLAALTADARLGRGLQRLGLLRIPEEVRPPSILVRANELARTLVQALPDMDAISRLSQDEALVGAHAAMIETRPRRRGEIDTQLAVGLARLEDARSAEEARLMLNASELNAVLSDRNAFQRLMSVIRSPVQASTDAKNL